MEVSSKNQTITEKNLCLYCDKWFANDKEQESHVERDHKTVKTPQGKGSRKSERITKNHLSSENSSFPGCFHCNKKFIRTDDLDILFQHLLATHQDVYFGCKCKIRTQDKVSLANHKKICKISGGSSGKASSKYLEECATDNRKSSKKSQVAKSNGDSFSELENNVSAVAASNKSKTLPPAASAINKKSDRSKLKNHSKIASFNSKSKKNQFSSGSSTSSSKTAGDDYTIPLTRQKLKEPKVLLVQNRTASSKKSHKASNKSPETKNITTAATSTKVYRTKTNKVANTISQHPEPIEVIAKSEIVSTEFDDDFYRNISQNIRSNLMCFVDGKTERLQSRKPVFEQISEQSESSKRVVDKKTNLQFLEKEIHESTNFESSTPFPALLTAEQYGFGDSSYNKNKRHITRNSWKWKWDLIKKYKYVNEGGKIVKKVKQITTGLKDLSQLDMWTQLSMRSRYENLNSQPGFDDGLCDNLSSRLIKTQNIEQLNMILNKRLIPQIDVEQLQQTVVKEEPIEDVSELDETIIDHGERDNTMSELLDSFNLVRNDRCNSKKPLLSGEWARPRCYICVDCGQKFDLMKSLNDHKNSEHPYVVSAHYEIVGRENLEHKLYENLFLPKKALKTNRYSVNLPINGDSKSNETNEASTSSDSSSKFFADQKEKECSKCLKMIKYSSDIDIYRHILDCIEDRVWIQAKKRSKYRRSRRKSRKNIRKSKASYDQKKSASSPSTKDNTEGENSTLSISNPPTPKSNPKMSPAISQKPRKIESIINDSKIFNSKSNDGMNIKHFFKVSKTTVPSSQKLLVQALEIMPSNENISLRSSLRSSSTKRHPRADSTDTASQIEKDEAGEKFEAKNIQPDVRTEETTEVVEEKMEDKLTPLTLTTPLRNPSESPFGSPTVAPLTSPTSNSNVPKKKKKLNDCIAMLTCKIQEKLGVNFFDNNQPRSELSEQAEISADLQPIEDPKPEPTVKLQEIPCSSSDSPVCLPNITETNETKSTGEKACFDLQLAPEVVSKAVENKPSNSFQMDSILKTEFLLPVQDEVIDLSVKKKPKDTEVETSDVFEQKSDEASLKEILIEEKPAERIEEPSKEDECTTALASEENCEAKIFAPEHLSELKDEIPEAEKLTIEVVDKSVPNAADKIELEIPIIELERTRSRSIMRKGQKTSSRTSSRKKVEVPVKKDETIVKACEESIDSQIIVTESKEVSEPPPPPPPPPQTQSKVTRASRARKTVCKNEVPDKLEVNLKSTELAPVEADEKPLISYKNQIPEKCKEVPTANSSKKEKLVHQELETAKTIEVIVNSTEIEVSNIDKDELAKAELQLIEDLKVSIPKEKIPNLKEILEQYQVITINNIKISESERRAFEEQKNRILQILNKTNNAKKVPSRKASKKTPKRRSLTKRLTSKKKVGKKTTISKDKAEQSGSSLPPVATETLQDPSEKKIVEAIKTTNRIRCRRLSVVVDPIINLSAFQNKNRKIRLTNNSQQNGFLDLLAVTEPFFPDNKVTEPVKAETSSKASESSTVEKVSEPNSNLALESRDIKTDSSSIPSNISLEIQNVSEIPNSSVVDIPVILPAGAEIENLSNTKDTTVAANPAEDKERLETDKKKETKKKSTGSRKSKSVPESLDSKSDQTKSEIEKNIAVQTVVDDDIPVACEQETAEVQEKSKSKQNSKKASHKKSNSSKKTKEAVEESCSHKPASIPENFENDFANKNEKALNGETSQVDTEVGKSDVSEEGTKTEKEVFTIQLSSTRSKVLKIPEKSLLQDDAKLKQLPRTSTPKKSSEPKKSSRKKQQLPLIKDVLDTSISSNTSNENDIPLSQLLSNESQEKELSSSIPGLNVDLDQKSLKIESDEPSVDEMLQDVVPSESKLPSTTEISMKKLDSEKEMKLKTSSTKKHQKGKSNEKPIDKLQNFLSKTAPSINLRPTSGDETKKTFDPFAINDDSLFNDDLDNDPSDKINDIVNNIINSSEFQIDSDTEKSEVNDSGVAASNQNLPSCLICKRTFRTEKVYEKHCTTSTHIMKVERKNRFIAKINEKVTEQSSLKTEPEKAPSPILDETKVFRTKGALKTFDNILDTSRDLNEKLQDSLKEELAKKQQMLNENDDKFYYEFKMEKKPEDMTPKDQDQLFDSLFNSLEANKSKEKKQLCYTPKPTSMPTPQDSEIESTSTSWDLKHDADIDFVTEPLENVTFANAIKERYPKKFPVKINKSKDTAVSIPTKTLIMGKIFKKHRDREKQKTPQADAPNNKPEIKNSLDEIFDHLKNSAEIDDKVLTCPSPKTILKNSGGTFSPNASNDMIETASQSNNNNILKNKSFQSFQDQSNEKDDRVPSKMLRDDCDEDDGVVKRKSRRRCAIQAKTFAETWSSDEYEELHDTEDIISIINEIEKRDSVKKRKLLKLESLSEIGKKFEGSGEVHAKNDKMKDVEVRPLEKTERFVEKILKADKHSNSFVGRQHTISKDGHKSDEETFTATKDTIPVKSTSCIKKRRMSCFVPSTTSFDDRPKSKTSVKKILKEVVSEEKLEPVKRIELPKKTDVVRKIEPIRKPEPIRKIEPIRKPEPVRKLDLASKTDFKKLEVNKIESKSKPVLVKNVESEKPSKNHKKSENVPSNFSGSQIVKKKAQKHRKRPRNRPKNIAYDSDSDFELNINKKSKSSAISESSDSDEDDKKTEEMVKPTGKSVSTTKICNANDMTVSKEPKLLPNDLKHVVQTTAKTMKAAIPEDDIFNSSQNACNRTKRHSSEKLYYWSSSSSESDQDQVDTADGDNEDSVMPQQPEQHGWIVGDSHKKLVTLLAHAKIKNKIN